MGPRRPRARDRIHPSGFELHVARDHELVPLPPGMPTARRRRGRCHRYGMLQPAKPYRHIALVMAQRQMPDAVAPSRYGDGVARATEAIHRDGNAASSAMRNCRIQMFGWQWTWHHASQDLLGGTGPNRIERERESVRTAVHAVLAPKLHRHAPRHQRPAQGPAGGGITPRPPCTPSARRAFDRGAVDRTCPFCHRIRTIAIAASPCGAIAQGYTA